uniref:Myb/SANT-like domain-containing protein n=1 Tax=Ananas comosus var. bracteatus TaxID=296719 RepID=A0A6V7QK12_ANACO|nr:unnamed protein product [Ananas comosus var. bracteatus]
MMHGKRQEFHGLGDSRAKQTANCEVRKNYNIIEIASTESQSIKSHDHETSKTRVRYGNWTEVMGSAILNLMTEEHVLDNFVNGSSTSLAWTRIVHDFNARTKVNFAKSHLQNRLKVLKWQFIIYQTLANKSGWGWDYDRNIPIARDPSDWDAVVAENPTYSRHKDKPFPAYQDIAFLSRKTTAQPFWLWPIICGSTLLLSPANEERPNNPTFYSPTPTPMKSEKFEQ